MSPIVSIVSASLNTNQPFLTLENELLQKFSEFICAEVSVTFEAFDDQLCLHQGHQILRKDSRTIQRLFGSVTFKRRLVVTANGDCFYPFDQAIGLQSKQRYSALFKARVAKLISHGTMRSIALTVNQLTPATISHQSSDDQSAWS